MGTSGLENLVTCKLRLSKLLPDIIPLYFKILFIAYFGGYTLLPRQFRMEQEAAGGDYRPVPTEISNGQGQSTPLLAEEHEVSS